jgi:hypothetical protein
MAKWDRWERKVIWDHKDHKVKSETTERLEIKDRRDYRGRKDYKVYRDHRG